MPFFWQVLVLITPAVCCQNFDLFGNKLKSCPRYRENIVYTGEKTATPKRQILLKMVGRQRAKDVQKRHEFWYPEEVQILEHNETG